MLFSKHRYETITHLLNAFLSFSDLFGIENQVLDMAYRVLLGPALCPLGLSALTVALPQ